MCSDCVFFYTVLYCVLRLCWLFALCYSVCSGCVDGFHCVVLCAHVVLVVCTVLYTQVVLFFALCCILAQVMLVVLFCLHCVVLCGAQVEFVVCIVLYWVLRLCWLSQYNTMQTTNIT